MLEEIKEYILGDARMRTVPICFQAVFILLLEKAVKKYLEEHPERNDD